MPISGNYRLAAPYARIAAIFARNIQPIATSSQRNPLPSRDRKGAVVAYVQPAARRSNWALG